MKEIKGNNKGFSLVEIIVVIAIMVILIGVLSATILKHVDNTAYGKDMSALDSLHTALKDYIAEPDAVLPGEDEVITLKKLMQGNGGKLYDPNKVIEGALQETFKFEDSGTGVTACTFNANSKVFVDINWEDILINIAGSNISILVPVNNGSNGSYVPYTVGSYSWTDAQKIKD